MEFTATDVRNRILQMAFHCGRSAHIGGALSMVEVLTVLYRDIMKYDVANIQSEDRDRFILSKGHCVLGLYAILIEAGVIDNEKAFSFLQNGSMLGSHPVMNLDIGIESSSGSLGQGISMAVGIAKAAKLKKENYQVYTLIGNGECNEGAVWEAAILAAQWKLDNLTIVLDNNGLQSDGKSEDIIDLSNIEDIFRNIGFTVVNIDGHNEAQIREAFTLQCNDRPKIIIANTIKGKGVSFMENNNEWHHNRLTQKVYEQAVMELEGQYA